MAKVTICIPTFEQPIYCKRLLDSIFEQNYDNFDIVLTDNSKSDSIKNIINKYPPNQISYHKNTPSLGPAKNWNKAIQLAKGEYIKIMHNDDWFYSKNSLRKFVKMLDENPKSDFAFSGSLNVSKKLKKKHYISISQANKILQNPRNLFLGNFIGAPSATIFKNNNLKFDGNLKWLVDIDLYIRMLITNNNFIFTQEPLVAIGIHDSQVTNECLNNTNLIISEYTYLYNKFDLNKYKKFKWFLYKLLIKEGTIDKSLNQVKLNYIEHIIIKISYNILLFIRKFLPVSFKKRFKNLLRNFIENWKI